MLLLSPTPDARSQFNAVRAKSHLRPKLSRSACIQVLRKRPRASLSEQWLHSTLLKKPTDWTTSLPDLSTPSFGNTSFGQGEESSATLL